MNLSSHKQAALSRVETAETKDETTHEVLKLLGGDLLSVEFNLFNVRIIVRDQLTKEQLENLRGVLAAQDVEFDAEQQPKPAKVEGHDVWEYQAENCGSPVYVEGSTRLRNVEGSTKEIAIDKWSQKVKEKEGVFPEGTFKGSPESIAKELKTKSDSLKQAMSRLNFFINRAGDKLDAKDKARLEKAKDALRELYGEQSSVKQLQLAALRFPDPVRKFQDSDDATEAIYSIQDWLWSNAMHEWVYATSKDSLAKLRDAAKAYNKFVASLE